MEPRLNVHLQMSPIAPDWAGPFRSRVVELEEALAVAEAHRREPIWKRQCQCAFSVDSGAGRPGSWRRHLLFPRRTGASNVVGQFGQRFDCSLSITCASQLVAIAAGRPSLKRLSPSPRRTGAGWRQSLRRRETRRLRSGRPPTPRVLNCVLRIVRSRCGSKCEVVDVYKLASAL